jgi:hypothetical protein
VYLKQHLILFVDGPPGPRTARRVYDVGMAHFGNIFKNYRSTAPGKPLEPWGPEAQALFETTLLPSLCSRETWGYGLSDGKPKDSWMMMFHGFRPSQEPDMASIYRFEFDWQVAPSRVRKLAEHLMNEFDFLSGYGGYFLQGRPRSKYTIVSSDRLFALAHRYWCVEIEDIEATAEQMKTGYKCVNWLTLIGEPFRSRFGAAIEQARSAAFDHYESASGVLLQSGETPILGDRNRQADLTPYAETATALLPLQIREHTAFWGPRWTEENTMAWIKRFTHPTDV